MFDEPPPQEEEAPKEDKKKKKKKEEEVCRGEGPRERASPTVCGQEASPSQELVVVSREGPPCSITLPLGLSEGFRGSCGPWLQRDACGRLRGPTR